ncbi:ParB/RepB/Spo0J family partition protein [Shewanella sp. SR43-4]|jgi:ParB family chromosome partitioning protein|uniref:Probable chromosome-partitioning protein ParB n=1 Tax=Shewanella vesiculosa TaxID=518738 RepID=A0ABV0FTJ4_9GAMM|nr:MULTISPECIES: ParB/RepB/Spo0J family partition protein [Shewanella]NCQ47110.1 ParB/RepB/Spo0J family partition protein [Shewanella frigidimarina]MBB1319496.1 ParB/RepB/Spo0J family partition protein [Shewanella sp. SR43-4]MBB1323527.1 ParB/RepB/Spo0J family partition protein [Shewanella sp. SR43-8]MBB1388833.1 ParB/RepB/Spo0J family partition protein [Shewanella sp. SG44-6]MBB1477663.1 ParB/RepB/Spo0J family partition protein [Shewanella sp. SG41-3]|tara:strand:- start:2160 stop:3041 length:882 start_codon:yes stop_codon:yes gene_type:complete
MTLKKRGLGKGLDALLSHSNAASRKSDQAEEQQSTPLSDLLHLDLDLLQPGKYQPRKDMSPEALEELAESIRAQGVIQPIVIRKISETHYEIIAGERRWRAAQLAKLNKVPCIVKQVADDAAVAIALIENIQREDLNAMEEAIALQRLLEEFELTHQQVADAVGKSRVSVSNLLRLNSLNEPVKRLLENGDIDMGHARALLALEGDEQTNLARLVASKEMTVRETERLVNKALNPTKDAETPAKDHDVSRLEQELIERLGAKVAINHGSKGKGKIVINYQNLAELDGILNKIR